MSHLIRLPLHGAADFDPAQTLDCGQAFRFAPAGGGVWQGVAGRRACRVALRGGISPAIEIECFCPGGCAPFWETYFDGGRDYGLLRRRLSDDAALARAAAYCPGMRLLRQDGWEALCSFILSQNNNIARIKGIIRALCENFGEEIPAWDGGTARAFPTARALAACSLEDLAPLRAGFRAAYLLDAARRVAGGQLDLDALRSAPLDDARAALRTIRGVGPKVADCALLYGFGRVACFPRDVWISRALDALYPGGFPDRFADVAGLAQQYLFHYCRTCPGALDPARA